MKLIMLAAILAGLAAPALAADSPNAPPLFAIPAKVDPTLKANPTAGAVKLGAQTLRLEQNDLLTLSQRFDAPIGQGGQGRDALSWICLTDPAQQVRLWLVSHYESDGAVDAITLARLPRVQAVEHCPDLPGRYARISLPNGIKLGMSGDALKAKLGKPTYDDKGLIAFLYRGVVLAGDDQAERGAEVFAAVGRDGVGAVTLHQHTLYY